mmetsp:Transcript_381/g.969  ORF Transcript_381/g.969 Transcript_381/m.969 type:complete len:197 (-) Transcript_381:2454-3044(-)
MEKQPNGYGITTSVLSVSHIGHFNVANAERQAHAASLDAQMKRDVKVQTRHLSTQHPYRKNLHLQKYYPDTLVKLEANKMQRDPALERKGVIVRERPRAYHTLPSSTVGGMNQEHQFNRSKLVWNRHCGLRSDVHEIVTGRGKPDPHPMLYPVNASHQQILVLEKKANSKNPNVPPPAVPPLKKRWMGENIGWQET